MHSAKKGSYYIILNGNISYKTQVETFVHELKHIVEDVPTCGYVIGMDMQHSEFEDDSELIQLLLG
ncbi:MAG: hypothetical protein ACRDDX_10395 [Cellulosilyticaceae bacterium]